MDEAGTQPPLPEAAAMFCGICGFSQSSSSSGLKTISCSRCHLKAHVSCLRIVNNERLPPPEASADTGPSWTCSCCLSKIEECGLSKNSNMFSKKADPLTYSCIFCNATAGPRCSKAEQMHMTKIKCGLWAHSFCHLLGNGACVVDSTMYEIHREDTPYDHWDVDMIVKFKLGEFVGKYAIIVSKPSQGTVQLRMRESSSSGKDSSLNEVFTAQCYNLQLGQPRKRDRVQVIAGSLKGHVGNVKMVLNRTEVVLDNLPSVDIIPLSDVAWLYISDRDNNKSGTMSSYNGLQPSLTTQHDEDPINIDMPPLKCLKCDRESAALVKCGEKGCEAYFHAACAIADKTFSVQVQLVSQAQSNDDEDEAENNIQLMLHCPRHEKPFAPPENIVSNDSVTPQRDLSVRDLENEAADTLLGEPQNLIPPPPNAADCTGCGKMGEYSEAQSENGNKDGNTKTRPRYRHHILSARETGSGREKYCGQYSLNPRYSEDMEKDEFSNLRRLGKRERKLLSERKLANSFLPNNFATGMDPGECTLLVSFQEVGQVNGLGDIIGNIEETEVRELFSQFGHIFKVETLDRKNYRFKVYFSEEKSAVSAVTKYSNYMNIPDHSANADVTSIYHKSFHLKTCQLGAEVYVGGLDAAVTEVKLKRVFQGCKSITIIKDQHIAFVKYLKLSSAKKAVRELNQVIVAGVSHPNATLTVAMRSSKQTDTSKIANNSSFLSTEPSWFLDRNGATSSHSEQEFASSTINHSDNSGVETSSHKRPRVSQFDGGHSTSFSALQASGSVNSLAPARDFDDDLRPYQHERSVYGSSSKQLAVATSTTVSRTAASSRSSTLSLKALRMQNRGNRNYSSRAAAATASALSVSSSRLSPSLPSASSLLPPPPPTTAPLTTATAPLTTAPLTTATAPLTAAPLTTAPPSLQLDDDFKEAASRDPRRRKL